MSHQSNITDEMISQACETLDIQDFDWMADALHALEAAGWRRLAAADASAKAPAFSDEEVAFAAKRGNVEVEWMRDAMEEIWPLGWRPTGATVEG